MTNSKMKPGYDGNAPVFAPTRDLIGKGGKREQIDGPTNLNHNRLMMLEARGIIDQRQLKAGSRLAKDWQLSQISSCANSNLVGNGASGGAGQLPNDVKVDAMKRHGAAMDACGLAWPIVEAVCCMDLRIDEAASRLRTHPRRATGQLEIGLDILARHYSMVDAERRRRLDAERDQATRD